MTDENKPEIQFKWVKPKEPKPEIYCNFVHTSWTLFDVRFQLGLLVPSDPGVSSEFVVQEQGSVTLGWPQIKNLRDMTVALIESYEKTNGEIKPLKLVPSPEPILPAAVARVEPEKTSDK